jgi:hypothetical protein
VLESANLSGGLNAEVDYFEEEFLSSLPTAASGDSGGLLDNAAPANQTDGTPLLERSLFNNCKEETTPIAGGGVNEVAVALTNLANFPSNFGTLENRFTNQNSNLNDEGYDSKGNLPHFADKPNNNMEEYFEQTIEGGSVVEAVEAPAAPKELDVMRLTVAQLRDELKRRGRGIQGKKGKLQNHLKEGILLNVLVALGDAARRHDCMAGLDMTAKWELLTRCYDPVPEPETPDANLRPPTEMNGAVNPKYGFMEMFQHLPFTGTTQKMQYCRPEG